MSHSKEDRLNKQVLSALNCLLRAFERSANSGRWKHLEEALQRSDNYFYNGLLTILLRIVFLLYVEERKLLQCDLQTYNKYFSLFTLFSKLQQSCSKVTRKQFGAWDHLITIFRITYYGLQNDAQIIHPRKGDLFDPNRFDLLEGSNFSSRLVEPFKVSKSAIIDNKTVYLVLKKLLFLKGERISYKTLNIGSIYEELMGYSIKRVDSSGGCGSKLIIQPNEDRRKTGSHYTPRSLAKSITEKTIKPLIGTPPNSSSLSEDLLNLKICDPAMGSGVFLVAACCYLAKQVVAAWDRENKMTEHSNKLAYAKQLVAQRCLYGVDKNPFAVSLAKLSLWITVANKNLSFTFVDHALRCGDALVGLNFEQITAFHWKQEHGFNFYYEAFKSDLNSALKNRIKILDLAASSSHKTTLKKERLLLKADNYLKRLRLTGDLVVSAYFGSNKPRERKILRNKLLSQLQKYLNSSNSSFEELEDVPKFVHAFHWGIEFPEVFSKKGMDAFIGNPPFAGKNTIANFGGPNYLSWLKEIHPGSHGNADYCAHFFRRASTMLGDHGTMGFIATNTISQGDTRITSLQWLVNHGHVIYGAIRSMPWPGNATVTVAICFLAKGASAQLPVRLKYLDGRPVKIINSQLKPKPERSDPQKLKANAKLSFVGSYVLGMGFTLTPEERDALIRKNPKNAECIFPYLGGEEVNTSPTQDFHRYVINFWKRTLEEAEKYPDLIKIVREKVKPERDTVKRLALKKYWWHYADKRPALYEAIRGLSRFLVTARVTKHLCFSFQPTDRILNEKVFVFPFDRYTHFAVLQSRIHEPWVRLLSSSLGETLNYAASDCFETFPFPDCQHLTPQSPLESIGNELYEKRAHYMVTTNQGLTQTYNKLKDPDCTDPPIIKLRKLHEIMDQAVLKVYGWEDIPVPPYTKPTTSQNDKAQQAFEDDIIDRLFELNYQLSKKQLK